jgi:hypothetical protein
MFDVSNEVLDMSGMFDVSNEVLDVGDHVVDVVDTDLVLLEDVSNMVVDMFDLDVLGMLQVLDHVVDDLSLLSGRELLDSELVSDHVHDLVLHGSPEMSGVSSDVATLFLARKSINGVHLVEEVFELLLVEAVGASGLESGEGLLDETGSLSKGASSEDSGAASLDLRWGDSATTGVVAHFPGGSPADVADLVDNSVDMDHVGGDDVSDGSNVSGGDMVSFEDVDEMSVNVASLDVLSFSDIAPDGSDHIVQLLARDTASLKVVVSLSDDGVSEHASDVPGDILVRPLVATSSEGFPRFMSSSMGSLVLDSMCFHNCDNPIDNVRVSHTTLSQVVVDVSSEVRDGIVHGSVMHPVV